MKKLTKEKKKRIKESLLKLLHVTCYILSSLFVLLMLVMGIQSCNNKRVSGVSADVEVQNLIGTSWQFNQVIELGDGFDYYINFQDNDDNNYIRLHANSSELYYYYGSTIAQSNQVYDAYEDYGWYNDDYKIIYIEGGLDASKPALINWLYQNATLRNEMSSFVFNKQFNYNAPIGLSVNDYFGGSTSQVSQVVTGLYRIEYSTGLFYSNGAVYSGIVIDYNDAGNNYFLINSVLKQGTSGELTYHALGYRRQDNNLIDFVNYRDTTQYAQSGGTTTTYRLNSSTWVNDAYRYIDFYSTLSGSTRVKVNAFNNNNQYNGQGYIGSGDVTNVFTLVASAFSGLLPILSMYILPGITIGMLIFLPLVVTLVFVIIKIIKK